MDDETKIHELVDRREEARKRGDAISPEEVCKDCLHLLPRFKEYIAALEWKLPWEEAQEDSSASDAANNSRQRPTPRHLVGDQFGQFKLEEFVAVGGNGEVWRASDTLLGPKVAVAIKIVPRADRSLEEAKKLGDLRACRGIVTIYHVGQTDDWTYFVSDYIDGKSLAEHLEKEQPSVEEAVRIAADVADALDDAHSKQIVHRDVKPGNILLDRHRRVFLTDFGIAITAEQSLDPGDACRGTLAYMSPEQVRGEVLEIDRRTDIYSMGVVLFQMLTGKLPFHGDLLDLRNEILNKAPPDPRIHNKSIPRRLALITLKCLQKDPRKRYSSSARTLATELRTFDQTFWWRLWRKPRVSIGFALAVAIMWLIGFVLMQHWKEAREAYNVWAAQVLGQAVDEYHNDHDGHAMAERMGAIDPAYLLSSNRAAYAKTYKEILMDCPLDLQARRVRAIANAKKTEPSLPPKILAGDVDWKGAIDEVRIMGGQVRSDEESSDKAIHDGLVIELDLDCTPVTDTTLELFSKNLPQVRILKLCATQVTDAGLVCLKRLTQLQQLYLGRTAVTDAGLEQLAKLSQLQILDLSDTDVTDAGLMHLHGLTQLRSLNVRNTKVAKAGMPKITAALPLLRIEVEETVPQPLDKRRVPK